MIVTVKKPLNIPKKEKRTFVKGQVWFSGRNYLLIINEKQHIDLGAVSRSYIAGPFFNDRILPEAELLPAGTKVTFETIGEE